MKKKCRFALLALCLALVLVFLPVFAEETGSELLWRASGAELNAKGTGGAGFEEKDGYGYRTLLAGVNTGVHPIFGLKTDTVETRGDSFVLVLKAKILSDDGTTEDETNVFGLDKYIKDESGKTLAGENEYCVRFTAGEVRNAEKDADGWSLFFCTVQPEQYGEGTNVYFDCEIYFNGAKNSGCAIDIAVTELSLYRLTETPGTTEPGTTEPEVSEPEDTEPEVSEPEDTEPEVSEPEDTEPEVSEPEDTEPEEPMNPYPPVGEFPPMNTSNLSGYGFATSDSYEGAGTIAVTAVDGDIFDASRWIPSVPVVLDPATGRYRNAAGKYAWLKIEFEIPTAISGARIYWAAERAYEDGYGLYYSNDDESWTEIAYSAFERGDGNGSAQSSCVDTILFEEITARYFCIRLTEGMTADGLGSIYEFELYGDPAQYAFLDRGEPGASEGGSDTSAPETTDPLPVTPGTEPTPATPGADGEEKTGHTKLILSIVCGVLLSAAILVATFLASRKIKKDHIVKGLSMLLVFASLLASLSLGGPALGAYAASDGTDGTPSDAPGSSPEVQEEENVREGWLLEGLPSYEGGTLSKRVYNAGPGLASDTTATTGEDSYMQIIAKTTKEEFLAYLDKLESLGYKSTYRGSREENLYAEYEGGGRRLYAYYIESLKTARVIDEKSGVSLDSFSYSLPSGESAVLYQYGLYQASPSLTTTNCGMLYVIKLADNSLFIVDGGHQYQSSDRAADGFMDFLHEITGTEKGERVTIAAWFITHAHADHLMLAAKVLHRYHDEIDLERVMFNFPSFQVVTSGYRAFPTTWFKHIVTTYYSNAVFLKPHTGMRFDLGNINIEVLYTHEDGVRYASPSTCSISNFNSTSTVLKFTFGEDKTFLLLGDADTEAESLMLSMYKEDATFKSDVLQVAHHAFNYMRTLYPKIAPSLALVPNSKTNAQSSENLPKIQPVIDSAGADNVYYEGSGTYGFAVVEGEWKLVYEKKLVSSRYDGSGF